jgi:two-component system response regulator HydG
MDATVFGQCYNDILNAFAEGVFFVSDSGQIVFANQRMEALTGFAVDELVGAPCTLLNCDVCEVIRSEGSDQWCKLFIMGRVRGRRCVIMRKDGSFLRGLKNASVLKDRGGEVLGAFETLTDLSELEWKDERIRELSLLVDDEFGFSGMDGHSPAMMRCFQIIEKAAQSDAPVIVYGESGTGKGLAAEVIHRIGRRRSGPFISFNCGALNEAVLDAELFGHTRGAFMAAHRHRMGRLEAAHGGDLFLDEIGDLPFSTQSRLLRVLETKQFERVGDDRPVPVDVRIIASTNRNLLESVSQGRFRQDLFFRLNASPIYLPPLRERTADIPSLVNVFLRQLREKTGKNITGLSPKVMKRFMDHDWPGNVGELKRVLEYGFVVADSGALDEHHLPESFAGSTPPRVPITPFSATPDLAGLSEKDALIEALRLSNGNKVKAAKILNVHRMTVWNRMKKYGVQLTRKIE